MRRGEAIVIGGFVAASILTLALAGYQSREEGMPLSPTSTGRHGAQGLAETLRRLGADVATRDRSMYHPIATTDTAGTLLLLAAGGVGDSLVNRDLLQFVAGGGHLVAAGDWPLLACVGTSARYQINESAWVLRPADIPSWCPAADWRIDTLSWSEDDRAIALRASHPGGGTVLALARSHWLGNEFLRHEPEAPDVVGWLWAPRPRHVVFQEPRMPSAGRLMGAILDWTIQAPPGWAVLQLALAGLAFLLVGAVRTGPVVPGFSRRRRSSLEHAEALAVGLKRADGDATAVNLLIGGLRRRVRGRPGPAGEERNRAWLAAFSAGLDDPEAREAAQRLGHLQAGGRGDDSVLAAAVLVEDVWNKVGRRTS